MYHSHNIMNRLLNTLLLLILLSTQVYGQKTIVGKVLNKTTHEPIPYANIGILNSNVGTLSNKDGSFSILIPERLSHDTLIFTSLGYCKKKLSVYSHKPTQDLSIYLDELAIMLKPIVIIAKRSKGKLFELGNSRFFTGTYEPDTTYAGRAVALLIDNRSFKKGLTFPILVKKASLFIYKNNFETFKFRIRINKYDSLTGKPGEDLIDKNIIVESSVKGGWLDFDLANLYFKATSPFFVTFEQLIDRDDRATVALGFRDITRLHPNWIQRDTLVFNGKKHVIQKFTKEGLEIPGTFIGVTNSKSDLNKYSCFIRQTSLAEWVKVPIVIAATISATAITDVKPNDSKEVQIMEIRL